MGLFNNFPYMDLSNLNLDFVLKKLKDLTNYAESAEHDAHRAETASAVAVIARDAAESAARSAEGSSRDAQAAEHSAENYAAHIADPVGGLVTGWLDDNITPTTPPVDASLTIQGAAADAKAAGDAISELRGQIAQFEAIPYEVKIAMDNLFKKASYLDDPGGDYATIHDWALDINVVSLSATFNQGSNIIYDNDSLDVLRQYLTVTAFYENSSSANVSGYTLSGALTAGTSTITVAYGGMTTTFTVNVTHWIVNVDVSKIIVGATNTGVAPNYYSTGYPARMSYPYFDILLTGGKTYRFTVTSSVNTAQIGIQAFNQNALNAVNANENFSATVGSGEVWDSGWQSLESTIQIPADTNSSPIVGVRFALRQSSSNPNISSNFVTAIAIEEVSE